MSLPGPPPLDDPARNYALIVAVEAYRARRIDLSLDGPAKDAIAWVEWLVGEQVPPGNIAVLASPLERNSGLFADVEVDCRIDPDLGNEAVKAALRRFEGRPGRLWLVWSGHGVAMPDGSRFVLLASYREHERNVLSVAALQDHLRTAAHRFPGDQVLAFDSCATVFDEFEYRQELAYETFGPGQADKACRQFLMFASEDRTVAINRRGIGGLFTQELLAALKTPSPGGHGDLLQAHERMLERFKDLRAQDPRVQRPIVYTWRAPDGNGRNNIALIRGIDQALDRTSGGKWGDDRNRMLKLVRSIWIDGRHGILKETLIRDTRALLELSEYPNAVVPPRSAPPVRRPDQEQPLPPGTRLVDVFDELGGAALLILGQPGAGKTTLLLELTDELLKRAVEDATHPIPVVFPLSTWAETRRPLAEWLVDELSRKDGIYQIGRKRPQDWVDRNQILPLLDGLDEVKPEHRAACARAIDDFRNSHGLLPLVVCSRTADYEALSEPLRLQDAVVVQALTRTQVDTYFAALGPFGRPVRRALDEDSSLWELLDTPLMLWVVTMTYAGDSDARPCPGGSREERRDHLFTAYVDRVLRHRYADRMAPSREGESGRRGAAADDEGGHRSGRPYPRTRTLHWLGWLARQMKNHDQTIFYIERLQFDWLPQRQQESMEDCFRRVGGVIGMMVGGLGLGLGVGVGNGQGLVDGLVAGLVGVWSFGIVGMMIGGVGPGMVDVLVLGLGIGSVLGLGIGLGAGLNAGLILGLAFVFIGWLNGLWLLSDSSIIECAESVGWSWPKFRELSKLELIGLLVGLLVFGLVSLLVGLLVFGPNNVPVLWCLLGILVFYMGVGLGFHLYYSWLSVSEIERRAVPNQGIHRSARNALSIGVIVGVIGGLVGGVIGGVVGGLGLGLSIGLIAGLIGGLRAGGQACLRHFVLRLLLIRSGSIPWNYAKFLNYAAERILLRKVGGGYTFIHRMLLDYFATRYDESSVEVTPHAESSQIERERSTLPSSAC